jgi:hypothetical protein
MPESSQLGSDASQGELMDIKNWVVERRARILLLTFSVVSLVASVSAIDFSTITDILDELVLIMPWLVAMIVAAIPIIVILMVVGFILGLFDGIVGKIRGGF